MSSTQAQLIFKYTDLSGPVLARWGVITGNDMDLVAASGSKLFLFSRVNQNYALAAAVDTGMAILSMAVGLRNEGKDKIILGTSDRIIIYGANTSGNGAALAMLGETEPEPGAVFVDLAAGMLDSSQDEMVAAVAEGNSALYIYRSAAVQPLELLAIRVLPGPGQKVALLSGTASAPSLIAIAYRSNFTSGLLTLFLTDIGLAEGPVQDILPVRLTALTGGDIRTAAGEELIWGGDDGAFRVAEVDGGLNTVLTSDNLGGGIPALASGKLFPGQGDTLVAGTTEGYLFGYNWPVINSGPDWAASIVERVWDLDICCNSLVAVGTEGGSLLVLRVIPAGYSIYMVKAGDTLSAIAARYQTTVDILAETNGLINPHMLYPSQVLFVPHR